MNGVMLVRHLKGTQLSGPREVDALAAQAGQLRVDDVSRVLELVTGRQGDPVQYRHRVRLVSLLIQQSGDRRLFPVLLRTLRTGDATLRTALVEAMPAVNDPAYHVEVCDLLRSNDAGLRAAAGQLISRVGGKTALARLTELLRESGVAGRRQAIEAAVRIAGHHAIPAFLAALPVASPREKQLIVRYLGDQTFMSGDRVGALDVLARLLDDPDEGIAMAAIQGFSSLATEDEWFDHVSGSLDSPHLSIVRTAVRGMGGFDSPRAIEALRGRLRTGPKAVRLAVLDTLEEVGSPRVLPALVDALGHRQLAVRTRAGEVLAALGASGKVEIARTVLWLLRSPEADVRRLAVEIARKAKDPGETLWPRLFELLRDHDWWVRERVADALIEMAGSRLLPYLVGFLTDRSAPVRMFAIEVIRRLREPRALGALVRAANEDADWWVRERAMAAIGELGDPRGGPYLVHIVLKEPHMRLAGLVALARLAAPDTATHVARLLTVDDVDVRRATLQCLEALGDIRVASSIEPLLADPDPKVRDHARRLAALWKLQLRDDEGGPVTPKSLLDQLLVALDELGADDLIIAPGQRPMTKRMGRVEPLPDQPALDGSQVEAMLAPTLSSIQLSQLEAREDIDFSYEVDTHDLRFRANVFHQLRGMSAVFRAVRGTIPDLDELGLPAVVRGLGEVKNGLVLIGGPTGSGKSTTLAALIDAINRTSSRHVLTLEDPIEVVHSRKRALVNQREVGTHTASYSAALRATLREDPDVILVGEMRDLPTIRFAVTAAETGHLVLGTVHTVSADTTLDRMINVFPPDTQHQVRSMLATSLRAVVCQHLLPRADGQGRALACEVMLSNDAVAHLVRTGKTFQLPSVIATGGDSGMQSMDSDLMRLLIAGTITPQMAWMKAREKSLFEDRLDGAAAALGD
ncbi:MAG: PilT/PilU family type 4a pilus ATPase [Alphaproteobacteria bacterium]|nr:PilT/PilU family type 4a pilus ATPase [Alphaproteobacteria bacterium]